MDTAENRTGSTGTQTRPPPEGTDNTPAQPQSSHRHLVTKAAAVLLLTGISGVLLTRVAGSDGFTPLPQLLAFLPWLLVPAAAVLVATALVGWRPGILWSLAVCAVTAFFTLPYGDASTGAKGPAVAELRVLTSNLEFGGATDALLRTIRFERPDLIFVQECDHRCAAALRRQLPGEGYAHLELDQAAGAEGSAIVSRFPLTRTPGVKGELAMPGAVMEVDGHYVRLQLAHPMPPTPDSVGTWRSELGRLRDWAGDHSAGPAILAGDFNATQDHAAFRGLIDAGLYDSTRLTGDSRVPSWPTSVLPPLGAQIDHVLVSRHFQAGIARFVNLGDTDHRSLIVELTLHLKPHPI
ncbi:endonuclease/exonuclease/phosphatase family protein [Streptomyces triticagri]|uniref:endonuclease/exonuclease/phosphatase family protein n=1 Tax=Streptomyces triticagri TaxID=2293568 RepID=UPI001F177A23|nr:endonuclease/exonuclease/phosphatase family protein [Streptomyces triticagri]